MDSLTFRNILKLTSIVLFLALAISNTYAWWDSNWNYRQQVSLTTSDDITDAQIYFTIDTATLIANGKLNSDCSDLRFADSTDVALSYWIETGCNSASTKVWIKANAQVNTDKYLYMYYGNSGATDGQSGDTTFIFFDDFEGTALDTTKWNSAGTINVNSGTITITGSSSYILSVNKNSDINTIVESKTIYNTYSADNDFGFVDNTNPASIPMAGLQTNYPAAGVINSRSYVSASEDTNLGNSWTITDYHILRIDRDGTTSVKFYIDNILQATHTTEIPTTTAYIKVRSNTAGNDVVIDWIRIRKYLPSDNPTYSIGSEETNSGNSPPSDPTDISGYTTPYYVGDTISGLTASGSTDPEGDTITYEFKITDNNDATTLYDWGTSPSYTFSSSESHDEIRLYGRACDYDGSGSCSAESYYESFTLSNTAPTTPSMSNISEMYIYPSSIVAVCSGSTDADSDTITYYYEFYNVNDSSIIQTYSTNNTYVIQETDIWKNIEVRCKAYDSYDYSSETTTTTSIKRPKYHIFVYDELTNASIGSFMIHFDNGTSTKDVSGTLGDLSFYYYEVPYGITNITISANGYTSTNDTIHINDSESANYTYYLHSNSLFIYVFDEKTLSQLFSYDITLSNSTKTKEYNLHIDWSSSYTSASETQKIFDKDLSTYLSASEITSEYIYGTIGLTSENESICLKARVMKDYQYNNGHVSLQMYNTQTMSYDTLIYIDTTSGNIETKTVCENINNSKYNGTYRLSLTHGYNPSYTLYPLYVYELYYESFPDRIFHIPVSDIPISNTKIKVSSDNYYSRLYYIDETNESIILNSYIPPKSESNTYTQILVLSKLFGTPIPDVLVTAQKSINGSYVTVGQAKTDSAGIIHMYFLTDSEYRLVLTKNGYITTYVDSISPTTSITVFMNESFNINFSHSLEHISYQFTPFESVLTNNTYLNFTIHDDDGDLLWVNYTISNETNVIYTTQETGSPSGLTLSYFLNTTNRSGRIYVYGIYRKENFDAVTLTKQYYIWDSEPQNYSMKTIFEDISNNEYGSKEQFGLVLILIIVLVASGLSLFGGIYAGLGVSAILGFAAYMGIISWGLFTITTIAVIAIAIIRSVY